MALTKYQGLGNDFLVLLDRERAHRYDPELAVALCRRHRGVGADGLLRLSGGTAGAAFTMELRNADGSLAETSGNGLRCAVLAALDAGWVHPEQEMLVATGAGTSAARVLAHWGSGAQIEVEMGAVGVHEESTSPLSGWRAFSVDVGNPHLVLVGDSPDAVDLAALGPQLEQSRPGGVNVELVTPGPGTSHCSLLVWERGAGLTLACGSGSCAAAAALRAAGIAGDAVEVANPGGPLRVRLSGPLRTPRAVLAGPAQRVAAITVELDDLDLPCLAGAAGDRL